MPDESLKLRHPPVELKQPKLLPPNMVVELGEGAREMQLLTRGYRNAALITTATGLISGATGVFVQTIGQNGKPAGIVTAIAVAGCAVFAKSFGAAWRPIKRYLMNHGDEERVYDIEADLTITRSLLFQTDRSLVLQEALLAVGQGASRERNIRVSDEIFRLMGETQPSLFDDSQRTMHPLMVRETAEKAAEELGERNPLASAKALHCAATALRMQSAKLTEEGLETENIETSVRWFERRIEAALGAHLATEGFRLSDASRELVKTSPADFPTVRLAAARPALRRQISELDR